MCRRLTSGPFDRQPDSMTAVCDGIRCGNMCHIVSVGQRWWRFSDQNYELQ